MIISELIYQLQKIGEILGDIEVSYDIEFAEIENSTTPVRSLKVYDNVVVLSDLES